LPTSQETDAVALHWLPEQLALPVAVMLSEVLSWSMHDCTSLPTLTYCPLQKSAPLGSEHCAVHPPVTVLVQLAKRFDWQSRSQLMFACAVQLPLQLA
jgi:hypothetical protein